MFFFLTSDKCGICKGNNETCEDIKGSFKYNEILKEKKSARYHTVIEIPKGATNIDILQPGYGSDLNYIALLDDQGQYLLNGQNLISPIKTFAYGGISFHYNGANSTMERVNSTYSRQLQRGLTVQVLSLRPMDKAQEIELVTYSYSISRAVPINHHRQQNLQPQQQAQHQIQTNHHNHIHNNHHHNENQRKIHQYYQWKMMEWSNCDKICFGRKMRTSACIQMKEGFKTPDEYCGSNDKKPIDEYEVCNTDCTVDWETTKSECSSECGDGVIAVKSSCVQKYSRTGHTNIVDASVCSSLDKLTTYEPCKGKCKSATWNYGNWQPVSFIFFF